MEGRSHRQRVNGPAPATGLGTLRSPADLLSKCAGYLQNWQPPGGIQRLVVMSAWGVAETRKDIPFWFRWALNTATLNSLYRIMNVRAGTAAGSLNFTAVRAAGLTNGGQSGSDHQHRQSAPSPPADQPGYCWGSCLICFPQTGIPVNASSFRQNKTPRLTGRSAAMDVDLPCSFNQLSRTASGDSQMENRRPSRTRSSRVASRRRLDPALQSGG